MFRTIAFCVALLWSIAGFAADRWVLLATHQADLTTGETLVDLVGKGSKSHWVKELRLIAKSGNIQMTKLTIAFGDGQFHVEERSIDLKQGERTRSMAVDEEGRIAERLRIEFTKVPAASAKTVLEVWGLATEAPAEPLVEKASASKGSSEKAIKARPRFTSTTDDNVCSAKNICTPVRVFFGTDRKRADIPERVGFGSGRAGELQLGRAFVTVPRAVPRKRGEIPLVKWWERWFFRVPAEGDPAKHFTIPSRGIVMYPSAEHFVTAIQEHRRTAGEFFDHAFVFVHGFNVSFDNALYRTAQIAYDLGSDDVPFGSAFLYSWPSAGAPDPTGYAYDGDSARQSGEHLQTFLDLVVARSGAKHVHLIAHSMGNVALLNALQAFAAKARPGTTFNQIILAAPDVDAGEFEKIAARILPLAQGVTLYASSKDIALDVSRAVHRGVPRAGDVIEATGPVVVRDMDTIDISSISTEIFTLGHGDYADRKELLNDIGQLFRRGVDARPPGRRNINHHRIEQGGRVFWRYAE